MADFREIASKAKAAHKSKVTEQERKWTEDRAASEKFVDTAVTALETSVIPLLEDAKNAFAAEGIEAVIERHYDVKNRAARVEPRVSFSCRGPKRQPDAYQLKTTPIFVSSDGESFSVGAGENCWDTEPKVSLGKTQVDGLEPLIAKAVEKAVTAYYDDLGQHPY